MQLTGDLTQICNTTYSASCAVAYGVPTKNLANTNYGVFSEDQGVSTALPDGRILMIFGDTGTGYWNGTKWVYFATQATYPCTGGTCGGITGGTFSNLSMKAIALIPAVSGKPVDPYAGISNGLPKLDAALTAGGTPAVDYTGLPTVPFMVNSSRSGTQPAAATPTISGLGTSAGGLAETIVAGREFNGLVSNAAGNVYAFIHVTRQNRGSGGGLAYMMESLVAKMTLNASALTQSMSSDLAFTKLYAWSSAPNIISAGTVTVTGGGVSVAASGTPFAAYMVNLILEVNGEESQIATFVDSAHVTLTPGNVVDGAAQNYTIMQAQSTNSGKFIENAPIIIHPKDYGWCSQLPGNLCSASEVLLDWGSSWANRQSNVYLLAMDMSVLEASSYSGGAGTHGAAAGIADAYYLSSLSGGGVPSWAKAGEEQAMKLLTGTTTLSSIITGSGIGEHSVRWSKTCGCFVMSYGSAETQGINIVTSTTPWGPWSAEVNVLSNSANAGWAQKIVHASSATNPDFNATAPGNIVTCAGCSGGVASNTFWDSTNTALQMGIGTITSPYGKNGNWYGPYLWPVEHDYGSGVEMFLHVSAFDPYNSFLAALQIPGSITITSPTASQSISGTAFTLTSSLVALSATASVEYDVDGETACIVYAAPWSCVWNTYYVYGGPGQSVTATARDSLNNTLATAPGVAFTVSNALPEPAAALTWVVTAPASPWSGTTTVKPTALLSGTNAGNNVICNVFVDGKYINAPGFQTSGGSTCNLGTSGTANFNTTQFNNGFHNVVFTAQDGVAPLTNIGWTSIAQWEQQIDFENGATAMELRLLPGYENFLCTTSLTNCPTNVVVTGNIYNTDETSSAAAFSSCTSSDTTVATVSACSSSASATVTQVGVGSAQITFTASGRTRVAWVHVNTANQLPHFGKAGTSLTSYDPVNSFYMFSVFQNCKYAPLLGASFTGQDALYPAYTSYGKDFVDAGFNTTECGIWIAPTSADTESGWQAKQNSFVNAVNNLNNSFGLHWLAVDGGMTRTTQDVYIATREHSSWTTPSVQYAFSSLAGKALAAVLTDETNAIWGGYPLVGQLTLSNSIFAGQNITCVSGGNCTVPIDSGVIQSGNSNFLIVGATTHSCLNSNGATGSVYFATSLTSSSFKFTNPGCGTITISAASDPALSIEPFVAWWTTPALYGESCSSSCTDYIHYDAFSQYNTWFNAGSSTLIRGWPVQSNYNATSVANWMSPPNSGYSTMYYNILFGEYIPQFVPVFNAVNVTSTFSGPNFQYRDKYRSLTSAARLQPVVGQGASIATNYGWEGYGVAITSITRDLVTFAAPHGISNIIQLNTRLWINGSSDTGGGLYAGKNFYVRDCPTATTCHIVLDKVNFNDAGTTTNQLTTATFAGGTVPVYALTASSTDTFGTNFVVNSENNSCTTHHTPDYRGQTVTFAGTNLVGGALNAGWTSNIFYYWPRLANKGCSGSQADGGILAQVPPSGWASTGGTARIVLNQQYTRGVNYITPSDELGPRFPFVNEMDQMILGASGVRIYLSGLANGNLDNPNTRSGVLIFRDTSNQNVIGQWGLYPRFNFGPVQQIWQAHSTAAKLITRLLKFEFQQRLPGPDLGQFFESTLRTGTYGNMLAIQSHADGTITRTIDLSGIVQSGQPTIKYCAGWRNITVSTIAAGTTIVDANFTPDDCSFIAYVGAVNAAAEYTPTIFSANLADVSGAASIAVQYAYSPIFFTPTIMNLALPNAVNCGNGAACSLPVDKSIGTVYYQIVYLNSSGGVLAKSAVQTL